MMFLKNFKKEKVTKKNQNWLPVWVLLFFLSGIFSPSCIDESADLEAQFEYRVDTTFAYEMQTYNKVLDSLCGLKMDSMVQLGVDSILKVREQQIERLLNEK